MNLLKKMSFLLFASLVMVSCGDDDTVDPAGPAITGLDFTITATGSGNIVEVLPSAVGATSYSVDFGSDATDDVKTTVGPKVSYTYPVVASDVTYTIKVTATAAGADSVSEEKEVTINYVAPNVIANFEDSPAVDITFYSKEDEVITTSIVTATAESATYGKVGKIVYGEASTGWKSFLVNPVKYLDLSTNDAVITMDYYQGDAKSVPVTLKLEGIKTDNDNAFTKIEVQVPTAAAAGWQKLTFDFSGAVMSGDGSGSALVLAEFHTIVLFIGVNLADGTGDAGTYEIDNISGVDFGAEVEDSDSDGVIDSLDKCPNAEGTEANDGCPASGIGADPSDDFEGNGNITWFGDSCGADIDFANPYKSGANISDTVLEYSDTGGQYANIRFDLNEDLTDKFDLSTKNIFKVMVYVPTPTTAVTATKQLELKIQDGSNGSPWMTQHGVVVPYEYDTWQELTFDFSDKKTQTIYSRVVVQFNGEDNNEAVKAYIDNFTYGSN